MIGLQDSGASLLLPFLLALPAAAQGNAWHDVDPQAGENIRVVVEIPPGSKTKYEIDHETGRIVVDRILPGPDPYPEAYGFVPRTFYSDGDPLDILVLGASRKTRPGAIMEVRIIGVLPMIDTGEKDDKLISVNAKDPRYEGVRSLEDVPPEVLERIVNFFSTYKGPGKIELGEFQGVSEAKEALRRSLRAYSAKEWVAPKAPVVKAEADPAKDARTRFAALPLPARPKRRSNLDEERAARLRGRRASPLNSRFSLRSFPRGRRSFERGGSTRADPRLTGVLGRRTARGLRTALARRFSRARRR